MFTSGGQAAPSKYCIRHGSASQIGMSESLCGGGQCGV
jgi:hypothetical protein